MNITLNAKINDLQSQLNTKMSKGELQISAIQEKLGKVEEDSTQLNATFIENDEELEVQIEELRESVAGSKADIFKRQDQMESSLASVKDQQIEVVSNEESCKSRLSSVEGEISSIRQGCFLAVFSSTQSITGGLPQQRHWMGPSMN